jgi:hypothetical protein
LNTILTGKSLGAKRFNPNLASEQQELKESVIKETKEAGKEEYNAEERRAMFLSGEKGFDDQYGK